MFFEVVDERIFDLTTDEFAQLMLDIGTRTNPPIDEVIRKSEKEYNEEDKKMRDENRNNLVAKFNYDWFVPEDIRYWFIKRNCDDEHIAELDEIIERIEGIEEVIRELSDIKTPHRFELYNTIEILRQQVIRSFDDEGRAERANFKLNKDMGKSVIAHGYDLDPKHKYVIAIEDEFEEQMTIRQAVEIFGLDAMEDYWDWLISQGFDPDFNNPTNEYVGKRYGKEPLWQTDLSQGIVMKAVDDDDYYIVMECSRLNEGFRYTQIILTPAGCM